MAKTLIDKKIEYWENQLLDLGKRNRMISYRETKRTSLKITAPDMQELFTKLVRDEKRLTFQRSIDRDTDYRVSSVLSLMDILEAPVDVLIGDIETEKTDSELQKTLKNLRARSRQAMEEQGIHILYLVFGFLEWREKNTKEDWRKSPLLLVPVSLLLESMKSPYVLKKAEEEVLVNPTLEYLFERDYGMKLPIFNMEKDTVENYMAKVEALIEKKEWKVKRECSLGLVSFQKINMYKDLLCHEKELKNHPIIKAFAGEKNELYKKTEKSFVLDHDIKSALENYLVVDADSSQQDAIALAKKGVSFVVQGPPGTGKSQTITNIIAQGMADGKKILFVSEKMAALEIVRKRLEEVQLADFCLSLHSHKADKKSVLADLEKSFELHECKVKNEELDKLRELDALREDLRNYVRDLHKVISPLEMSPYQVFGELVQMEDVEVFSLDIPDIECLSQTKIQQYSMLVKHYEYARNILGTEIEEHPWNGVMLSYPDLKKRLELKGELEKAVEILYKTRCIAVGRKNLSELITLYDVYTLGNIWNQQIETEKKIHNMREQILCSCDDSVFELDADTMLKRFRTDYTGYRKVLNLSYKNDVKRIKKSYNHTRRKITDEDMIELLSSVKKYHEELQKLAKLQNAESVMIATMDADLGRSIKNMKKDLSFILEEQELIVNLVDMFENRKELSEISLKRLCEKFEKCLERFSELDNWSDYRTCKETLIAQGLKGILKIADKNVYREERLQKVLLKSLYYAWIAKVCAGNDTVARFHVGSHNSKIQRFKELAVQQYQISQMRIRELLLARMNNEKKSERFIRETEIFLRELEKKRRIMPLRKLFHKIPNLLLTLKPCFMMSPLSVAYFLEGDTYRFDMVILDEASQIFPQDAIGAIFRGSQVIIAGDSKQLPPTNFFTAGSHNEDLECDVECDGVDVDDVISASILEEGAMNLKNCSLLWHYRSRNEDLISFSNKEIYKNKLITFPGTRTKENDTGVEYVYVENGIYENQSNKEEAKKCVELVKEHIRKYPERSLGIIAFSESQQNVIEEAIQVFRLKNKQYEYFFDENREAPFFIKNLENVQGDERDTIIFSIGYGKNARGQMYLRFGPLGQQGGERRLNVAITRGKYHVKVVTSIYPEEIDLSKTKSEGVKMLRAYMQYALEGTAAFGKGREWNSADEADIFCQHVSEFLEGEGFKIQRNVGNSQYKIDIAVEHPDEEGGYIAGIECDGVMYKKARTVHDREYLRQAILQQMGWNMYRVWSTEWMRNPENEKKRLLEFLREIYKACGIQNS